MADIPFSCQHNSDLYCFDTIGRNSFLVTPRNDSVNDPSNCIPDRSIPQPIFQEITTPGCLESATFPGPAVTGMMSFNPNAVLCPLPTAMWSSIVPTSAKSDNFLMRFILSSPYSLSIWRSNCTVATATGIPLVHLGSAKDGIFVSFDRMNLFSKTVCKSWTVIESSAFQSPCLVWISTWTVPLSRHNGTPRSLLLASSNDSHLGRTVLPFSKAYKKTATNIYNKKNLT